MPHDRSHLCPVCCAYLSSSVGVSSARSPSSPVRKKRIVKPCQATTGIYTHPQINNLTTQNIDLQITGVLLLHIGPTPLPTPLLNAVLPTPFHQCCTLYPSALSPPINAVLSTPLPFPLPSMLYSLPLCPFPSHQCCTLYPSALSPPINAVLSTPLPFPLPSMLYSIPLCLFPSHQCCTPYPSALSPSVYIHQVSYFSASSWSFFCLLCPFEQRVTWRDYLNQSLLAK